MKAFIRAALVLAASGAQAQFLDPNIIRQAGETMTSGNLRLDNVELGNTRFGSPQVIGVMQEQRMPTAQEIAAELRAQEQHAQREREAAARQAQRARISAAVERAYHAEYRK